MRLRWELCKTLGKTLDDPMFLNVSPAQWLLYAALIRQDRKDEVEKVRDFIEYGASFWDSKAVEQVRESRKHAKKTEESAFEKILKQKFGRGLGDAEVRDLSINELGAQIKQAARRE